MDLNQNKLSKFEWNSIEIPSTQDEKDIYNLIINGFNNLDIIFNNSLTIQSYLKLHNKEVDTYIYKLFIEDEIIKIYNKNRVKYNPVIYKDVKINKIDKIRLENISKNIFEKKQYLVEFIILRLIEELLENKDKSNLKFTKYYYSILTILNNKLNNFNKLLESEVLKILSFFEDEVDKNLMIKNIKQIVIDNDIINNFKDKSLFIHQKKLFNLIQEANPKLIFYTAPTGTGKTLSPLGISEKYKIIFVCAVRHIGLALAKACITCEKCVAFAFGCNNIEDIRLHYYSAKDYIKNKKTGGIFKVDNSVGDKVQIMICDIKSYLLAMRYMLAFNRKEDIVLYWDEPTITLDYKEHEFHEIIKNNWASNEIPNIVLSSATLPDRKDLLNTINNYKIKFDGNFYEIKSYDFRKSISIISREGYVIVPHYLCETLEDFQNCKKYLHSNNTILKYIDIEECCKFILYINKKNFCTENYKIENYFDKILDISIENIKLYYIELFKFVNNENWLDIKNYFLSKREKKINSSIYIATEDAHTLTNGPTLYLTNDIEKIGIFCLQSSKIPDNELNRIEKIINSNNIINDKINVIQKNYDDIVNKNEKKDENKFDNNPELKSLTNKINLLKNMIEPTTLSESYIPNSKDHLFKYKKKQINAFTSEITDEIVEKIMQIENIENHWKVLLLMGIGVFSNNLNDIYLEIMKELAKNKKLYLIIASSDFIYGTNYQFDHCILGKDLSNMTQEKIIQSMGRVGRNKISDNYTVRLRDNDIIKKIFFEESDKIEVLNMQNLF